eukprot:4480630-Prymnesium_polylepis.1
MKRRSSRAMMKKPDRLEGLYKSPPSTEIKGPSGRMYAGESCCCFKPADTPRRWAILFVESKPFDPVILVTIIANCTTMAWESPLDPCCTWKAGFIDVRLRRAPLLRAAWPRASLRHDTHTLPSGERAEPSRRRVAG